jgi:hypothetical protein
MTSEVAQAPDFRVTVAPSARNGVRVESQVVADNPVTARRERIGRWIGRLDEKDLVRVNIALAFVLGLADWTVAGRWLRPSHSPRLQPNTAFEPRRAGPTCSHSRRNGAGQVKRSGL